MHFIMAAAAVIAACAASETARIGPPTGPAASDKIDCRSYVVTGSLIRKRKVCNTMAEWRRLEALAREEGAKIRAGTNSCTDPKPCGCGCTQ
jgi:hypothetical protein